MVPSGKVRAGQADAVAGGVMLAELVAVLSKKVGQAEQTQLDSATRKPREVSDLASCL